MKKIFSYVWMALGVSFVIWQFVSMQATNVDPALLTSSPAVRVTETEDTWSFIPPKPATQEILFFPGALVQSKAYVPLAHAMATAGYSFTIIKMPLRLANRGYKKITELFPLDDTTRQFILAGHSQGGKMAATFVHEFPGKMDGLVLMGTTHPKNFDLTNLTIPVLKITASNDGLASTAEVNQYKSNLPASTQYAVIAGGNHAQFGYYGVQLGDDKATVSHEEQLLRIKETFVSFLKNQY